MRFSTGSGLIQPDSFAAGGHPPGGLTSSPKGGDIKPKVRSILATTDSASRLDLASIEPLTNQAIE